MSKVIPNGRRSSKSNASDIEAARWIIPYVDQPIAFWQHIAKVHPGRIEEVYFPLSADIISSGEPTQPSGHLKELLNRAPFKCSVLLNPMTLHNPVEQIVPGVIEELKRLRGDYGLSSATVTNLTLAMRIREAIPDFSLTASCLMQVAKPNQVAMLDGIFDNLVPAARIMRDLPALTALKEAFHGRIRLLVNECCLPGCPFRVQHFHEMGCNLPYPLSLCDELLNQHPWMRLTGGWVLPQHLHLYDGVYDDLKLGGRVTLKIPEKYYHVLQAYIHRQPLAPNEIGGGPGSVRIPINITEEFFAKTLKCHHQCHKCSLCRDYFDTAVEQLMEQQEVL